MNVNPAVYQFPAHCLNLASEGNRYLPWFTEDIVLAFDVGRWLDSHINENLNQIDTAAHQHGYIFYYHPRDNKSRHISDDFYYKPMDVFKEFIHDHFFEIYGSPAAFIRRLDDSRFLGWLKSDIVMENGSINWPTSLFDPPNDISFTDAPIYDLSFNPSQDLHNLPDPNVWLDDFERHMYYCPACKIEEAVYIEKGYDFYNIQETEYRCSRCKKESFTISSGDIIFRWDNDENQWMPQVSHISIEKGFCGDCKPFFESRMSDLIIECKRCGEINNLVQPAVQNARDDVSKI